MAIKKLDESFSGYDSIVSRPLQRTTYASWRSRVGITTFGSDRQNAPDLRAKRYSRTQQPYTEGHDL